VTDQLNKMFAQCFVQSSPFHHHRQLCNIYAILGRPLRNKKLNLISSNFTIFEHLVFSSNGRFRFRSRLLQFAYTVLWFHTNQLLYRYQFSPWSGDPIYAFSSVYWWWPVSFQTLTLWINTSVPIFHGKQTSLLILVPYDYLILSWNSRFPFRCDCPIASFLTCWVTLSCEYQNLLTTLQAYFQT